MTMDQNSKIYFSDETPRAVNLMESQALEVLTYMKEGKFTNFALDIFQESMKKISFLVMK